jgi:hypothetical protein
MLKEIAAIGVSAAIAFAPLAALAQTDQAAPGGAPAATDQGSMAAKPMKKKTHHMAKSKMKKPMAPASSSAPAGGAPPANPQ